MCWLWMEKTAVTEAACGIRKDARRWKSFARSSIVAVELAAAGKMTGWLSTVIIELSQDSTGRLSEESIVDVARAVTVSFCDLCEGHQSPHSHGTRVTAR